MVSNLSSWNEPVIILCIILALAILLDLLIGDPHWLPHPVVQIGKLISLCEGKLNQGEHRLQKGCLLVAIVLLIVFFGTYLIVFLAYQWHPLAGAVVEIYFISTTIAINGLRSAALQVYIPLTTGNLDEARRKLRMIVGRDTENLSESEVVRGTVETVAENTVDGITAPLFWAVIGGAPLAMAYRAINTLDSMVGYKNDKFLQFGRASAKLDDVVNWIPARTTAFAMWVSSFFIAGSKRLHGWRITMRDAKKHPSPNSGWPEAMTAGLLGVQLGGVNFYKGERSVRARMGDPLRKLKRSDIPNAIIYMHGGWLLFSLFGLLFLFVVQTI
ncbi:adenosylcobinamide-phosphate synthase CbiB [Alkalihalobacillus sp. MEB130]|uniref:adenosylcobinamide-phosphate synthase CbiB n=1 Tax=Alkalihalobacillus sp. MEB130 TaxID=2976704 RepID=UPI0028E064B0|nr:adenosylcobinamide-phosphate synthase CbiB [Alkalihalobacillus sp. MEB130]MDT8859294.1 adenosylcobinamide-phosphate synthase CbiB [Alkalihalobacillus sp. MEB130]